MRTSPQWWVKLGDFGITKRIDSEHTALQTRVGTARYLAPEVEDDDLQDRAYTKAVDIWSLGCVLYHALAQEPPFPNMSSKKKPFPESPIQSRASQCGVEFIRLLLAKDAIDRPTAMIAREHPWFIETSESNVRHSVVESMPSAFLESPQIAFNTKNVGATGNTERQTPQQSVHPPEDISKAHETKILKPTKTTNHVTRKLIIPQPVPTSEQQAASEETSSPGYHTPIEAVHWEDQAPAVALSRNRDSEKASNPRKHPLTTSLEDTAEDTTSMLIHTRDGQSSPRKKDKLVRIALVIQSTIKSKPNDLELKEGQYIVVTEMNSRVPWRGRTRLESTGFFPSDHVRLVAGDVSEDNTEEVLALPSATLAPLGLVRATRTINIGFFGYMGFEEGDLIQVLGIVRNHVDCWHGVSGNQIGMFHVDWVERIGEEVKGLAELKQIIALSDYTPLAPNNIGQLEYRAGDLIEVQRILNGPWWQGAVRRSGATGYFHLQIASGHLDLGEKSLDDLEARQKSHFDHKILSSVSKRRLVDKNSFDEPKPAVGTSPATQIPDLNASSDTASPVTHEQRKRLAHEMNVIKLLDCKLEEQVRAMIVLSPCGYPETSTPSLWFPTQTRVGRSVGFMVGRYSESRSQTSLTDSIGFQSKVVSRDHCLITYSEKQRLWFIEDVKSSGGTWLNRRRLSAPKLSSAPWLLNNGDVVQLGVSWREEREEIFRPVIMKVTWFWKLTS